MSTTNVGVRQATEADGDSLLELWHQFTDHLSEHDPRYEHSTDADEQWLSHFESQLIDSKYGTVFVAEAGDQIVGVLEARISGGHPIFRLSDHGFINGHLVVKEYRGEGVGEQLVEAAVQWFEEHERDIDFCRVDTLESDDRASAAYEAMGFKSVERTYERHFDV